MAPTLRYRSGLVELHRLPVDSETLLAAGDLVYLDANDVKPASAFPFTTDLATTRGNFAALFLGVCHQPSPTGETANVSVDLSPLAIYEYAIDAAAVMVGDLFACDAASNVLQPQRLTKVTSAAQAIARAAEHVPNGAPSLRVQFASAFHPASSNVNAAIG